MKICEAHCGVRYSDVVAFERGGASTNGTVEAMQMHIGIPANRAVTGYGVPQVCSRHGEPGVQPVETRLQSWPPRWTYAVLLLVAVPHFFLPRSAWAYLLFLVGWLVCIIAVNATRKTVLALWPFCRH